MDTKICSKCKIEKALIQFDKAKFGHLGYAATCKDCFKLYPSRNKDTRKKLSREYYVKNKVKIRKQNSDWYFKNKNEIRFYNKKYQEGHKEKIKIYKQKYFINNYYKNINFKLKMSLRHRLYILMTINKTNKSKSALKLLGCPLDFFKQHLEAQFKEGMNWNNYGKWHIDHIYPCSSFDFSKLEEQQFCFHWSNMQPLWAYENLEKGCKE